MKRRETLDESSVIIDGKRKTVREYLTETEDKADGLEFSAESAKFLSALPKVRQRERALTAKPKAVYSRRLTPGEIIEEEVQRMAAQAEKTLKFLMSHPKEWYTAKEICKGIGENPTTASPTVSRVVKFFGETEPDLLQVKQVGRARHIQFIAMVGDVDKEAQLYNKKYLEWLNAYVTKQKAKRAAGKDKDEMKERKPKREVYHASLEEEPSPEKIKKAMRSFDPGEKITIKVEGSIKILFGFAKGDE